MKMKKKATSKQDQPGQVIQYVWLFSFGIIFDLKNNNNNNYID